MQPWCLARLVCPAWNESEGCGEGAEAMEGSCGSEWPHVGSHPTRGGQQRPEKMPALGLGPARLNRVATLLRLASHFFRSLVCVCVCVCEGERERERRVCVCFSVWGRWVCVWERKGGGGRTWEKGGRDRGILTKVKLCLLILCDISRHATLINSAQLV